MQGITAVSQQSRFHAQEVDHTANNDVDLQGVTILVGDKELIGDAHLKLIAGRHYGLIGRNGVGKSTLLKSIGFKILVGLPRHLRVLYVDQLENESAAEHSVLDTEATDGGDGDAIAGAVRAVKRMQLEAQLAEAQLSAAHLSGARGAEARLRLTQLEAKDKCGGAGGQGGGGGGVSVRLAEVEDADSAQAKARRALFVEPDVLLLDEPTNSLDLPAILWLQEYVKALDATTLLIVSHDRAFLNETVEEVIELRHATLSYYAGNYDQYALTLAEARLHQERVVERVQRKRDHIQKTIQGCVAQAARSGDDKKLSQVASRRKKLERLGVESNAKGHRFKLNRDRPGFHSTARNEACVDLPDAAIMWAFPNPLELKTRGPLVQLDAVDFAYSATPAAAASATFPRSPQKQLPQSPALVTPGGRSIAVAKKFILTDSSNKQKHSSGTSGGPSSSAKLALKGVTVAIQQGARVALVGENGQGKSTLLGVLAGLLAPTGGAVKQHPQAKVGYFVQNQVEQLAQQAATCALELLHAQKPEMAEQELRAHLAGFGLKGTVVVQPLSNLSGGQIVRVALAQTLLQRPQLLLLDEPSTHLDIDSISALIDALAAFEGAVVMASHDQHLVSSVAEEVYLVKRGELKLLPRGMEQYVQQCLKS
eukprot:jgi/Mesen1/8169/ME000438S07264